ncbi:hypothetical protein ACMGGS_16210 [Superficieibacter sp. BNK-5]|uniref:hypothetical protein n=1 Tax=Superficieibacter sp. BNK-5 TaxID=3376142 RepID=UPI0039BF950E
MTIQKIIGAALLFMGMANACAEEVYADIPTKQASELVTKYTLADTKEKKVVQDKLNCLSKHNPNNNNVIRAYSSILISEGDYSEAVSLLNRYNAKNNDSSLKLQECMLKERTGEHDTLCYKHVISLVEGKGIKDTDYLMALFFTDDKRFTKEKEGYIARTGFERDLDIFNKSKSEVLQIFYPN